MNVTREIILFVVVILFACTLHTLAQKRILVVNIFEGLFIKITFSSVCVLFYTTTFIAICKLRFFANTRMFLFLYRAKMTDSADIYYSIAFEKVNIDLFVLLYQQFAMI